jgi:hypothetical protein
LANRRAVTFTIPSLTQDGEQFFCTFVQEKQGSIATITFRRLLRLSSGAGHRARIDE